jgi:cell wall-associated NlpC family hydrolase
MLRCFLAAVALFLVLAGPALGAASPVVEVLDGSGRITAQGAAGPFAYPADASAVDVGSASATRTDVELDDVSLLGSRVQITRIVVPRHGLRGAAVEGLVVDGRVVPTAPNTLVPLGGSSYLVVLQTAVVPGSKSRTVGLVGIRVHIGEAAFGLPAGTDLLIGLPPATERTAQPVHAGTADGWATLGFSGSPGHGAALFDGPEFAAGAAVPAAGPIGVRAVAIAERYLGIPYVWGGADPATGFDCSGLVMYVYRQLGIDLLHFSGAQFHEGAPVSIAALAPGDLVFFDPGPRGPGHVGMYVGGGRFIQAPHTGDVVRISSLSDFGYASSYVGAVRPY